ncbi:glycosyltransferase [Roseimaritima ulvae]|uniref:Teichuronic acid biosynthesis glycosyltransferase TuaH n=1 Tax=Roseimaritima ulvae TaxID=980254 RepID=A0A5B9QX94_9BACT|nr:glycosyltransferase [Roseimaritima ulvae]QEG42509.1 hypothetical protein UC8_45480 [Roseimaritima ulvae]
MDRLIVFSDDWGRHPSSCQHLIRQLLPTTEVTWVNTIGMRPPRLDLLTARRGLEKIASWARRSEAKVVVRSANTTEAPEKAVEHVQASQLDSRNSHLASPTVIDAKMWPWMTHTWDRWLNQKLLCRQLHEAAEGAVAITTIPIVTDLIGTLPASKWVYYCVDDFSVWPGLDGKTLGRMEDALLPQMDRIVCVSDTLAEGIRKRGQDCEVLTHGVDLAFWQQPTPSPPTPQSPLPALRSPTVLFWGVVDRRMNVDWMLALADSLDEGQIVLAGPQQDPDPRLAQHERIQLLGPVPFEQLPELARQAGVLIMPYADLPVTRAMQPLKLKEYLATLKPVVVSPLPAIRGWEEFLHVAHDAEQFIALVKQQIANAAGGEDSEAKPIDLAALKDRLRAESWSAKAERLMEMIDSYPPQGTSRSLSS